MMRMRYTMPAGSRGKLHAQRTMARLERDDVHRWVFVNGVDPDVESAVRVWLLQRLDGFHYDLQARCAPPLPSSLLPDEAVVKATGSNPRMSVCGRPFRFDDLDDTGGVR